MRLSKEPILEYAVPNRRWTARHIRRFILVGCLMVVVGLAWNSRKSVAYNVKWYSCWVNSQSPGTVVYEEEPDAARRLLKDKRHYQMLPALYFDYPHGVPPPGFQPPACLVVADLEDPDSPRHRGEFVASYLRRRLGSGDRQLVEIRYATGGWSSRAGISWPWTPIRWAEAIGRRVLLFQDRWKHA